MVHFQRCGLWDCEYCGENSTNVCMNMLDDWEQHGFNKDDF